MLGTDSKELSHTIHVVEQVVSENLSGTRRGAQEPSQHGDGCGLTRTVMSQQSEDLSVVHLHVDTLDSLESVVEGLFEF